MELYGPLFETSSCSLHLLVLTSGPIDLTRVSICIC